MNKIQYFSDEFPRGARGELRRGYAQGTGFDTRTRKTSFFSTPRRARDSELDVFASYGTNAETSSVKISEFANAGEGATPDADGSTQDLGVLHIS